MKRDVSGGPNLSAVFVDYDNIYLSLRRKSEDAAKRFAKDAAVWLKAIEQGTLITPTNGQGLEGPRRIVMNRCYGNPVPRRNQSDNSTDMTSFPFVRHHFLRAGFEIVDCPPLTQQLKNSSDIRMVMDVRDYLHHDTYFDEFVILSGDADFTPVLHRLRAHARRTVIFANDYTAAPYTAISDGEIREADLIRLLLGGQAAIESDAQPTTRALPEPARQIISPPVPAALTIAPPPVELQPPAITPKSAPIAARGQLHSEPAQRISAPRVLEATKEAILATIVDAVRGAGGPVPIEMLADRAVRVLGQEKTAGTNWAGAGSFRGFLLQNLPADIKLTEQSPYYAYDVERHGVAEDEPAAPAARNAAQGLQEIAAYQEPIAEVRPSRVEPAAARVATVNPGEQSASAIQQAVARIFEACQAPPLGPLEYRLLFELLATELNENKLAGAQTVTNVLQRAMDQKLRVTRDDIRFVFDVVSEVDPWFEQGATASLFAGRFRNFVVARCRTQGLSLSADDIDLIDRLFTGGAAQKRQQALAPSRAATSTPAQLQETGWGDDGRKRAVAPAEPTFGEATGTDDFPRIVRSRMRG